METYTLKLPKHVMHNKLLLTEEKLVLAYVMGFERNGLTCFAKDEYIEEVLGIPAHRVQLLIQSLQEKKILDVKTGGGQRALFSVGVPPTEANTEDQEPMSKIFEI